MEHASDEVGIFKGFRVHKDSHGGLFLLKNHIRHYLNETERHQIHFLDLEHMNQLPEGENILKIKLKSNEPRKVHKYDQEHRMIGIYTREGQFHGKEVFTGVYGGLFLFNNGKKIRLGNSDWKYVEDVEEDKEKNEKKKVGIYIGKGKKHGHLVFQGKLGALYCLINENKTLVSDSEKKFVDNFQYLKPKKKQNQVKKNSDQYDEDNDSDDDSDDDNNDDSDDNSDDDSDDDNNDDSDDNSDDDSDENERNETEQDDESESDTENTEENSSFYNSINGKKKRIRH